MEKLSPFQIAIQTFLTHFGREISKTEQVADQNNQASYHTDGVILGCLQASWAEERERTGNCLGQLYLQKQCL